MRTTPISLINTSLIIITYSVTLNAQTDPIWTTADTKERSVIVALINDNNLNDLINNAPIPD